MLCIYICTLNKAKWVLLVCPVDWSGYWRRVLTRIGLDETSDSNKCYTTITRSLKIPKRWLKAASRRRADNTMATIKGDKGTDNDLHNTSLNTKDWTIRISRKTWVNWDILEGLIIPTLLVMGGKQTYHQLSYLSIYHMKARLYKEINKRIR